MKIPYSKPSITELEVSYINDAINNGWGANCYDYITQFEDIFAKHLNGMHCIATSSCTGALHLGLAALGIGPGDEVILADSNWIATLAPISHLGATPVLVDIDPKTWCIDAQKAREAITHKTKAIICTHLYGNLCDMSTLCAIGAEYGIFIIEDAAEALGAEYSGQPAGSMSDLSVFSFHGTKTITTGEGGLAAFKSPLYFQRAVTLSNHGRETECKKQFWPKQIGYKFKMSNLQAALGCAQMHRFEELTNRKREILKQYESLFRNYTKVVRFNHAGKGHKIGAWMTTCQLTDPTKYSAHVIINTLKEKNIDARPFFHPLSETPAVKSIKHVIHTNYNSKILAQTALNLPSFHDIDDDSIKLISNSIISCLEV